MFLVESKQTSLINSKKKKIFSFNSLLNVFLRNQILHEMHSKIIAFLPQLSGRNHLRKRNTPPKFLVYSKSNDDLSGPRKILYYY